MADKNVVQLEIQALLDGKGFDETKKQLKNIGVDIKKTGEDGEFSLSKIDASAKRSGESFINLAAKVTVAWKSITSLIKASIDQAKADAQLAQGLPCLLPIVSSCRSSSTDGHYRGLPCCTLPRSRQPGPLDARVRSSACPRS